ncbi:ABC transporter ATP-binding protein [Lachnoclostridium phytofermentans]|uniref:ABC transporter related n=1 Tax=Lachnoclostridium phytofermentans (strain ATCC 700394 / DSM 18823 / ISDg) TaxID=357809 RepID=A9KQZ2_LACP7|nr:ABC transporter ATP-binding protein [Lachnoclostridium phytofermentans]ABX43471.1 ABC transporter related [Lachnoclostridium phytofermentans ISDg]
MKFKKVWHDSISFIKLIKTDHPNIIWIIVMGALAGAAGPFTQLFFYGRVLNKVVKGQYQECILDIIILLTAALILNLIKKACDQSVIVLREACADTIYLKTAEKAFTMEYEEFEKTETMDAIRRVQGGENSSGGISNQIQSIYILIEKGFSILFSLAFVISLFTHVKTDSRNFFSSIWSSLLIIVVFTVIFLISLKLSAISYKKFYEVEKKNQHLNSLGEYMLALMYNYQYGKDIRIYSMQGLLDHYLKSIMKNINSIFLKWSTTDGVYTGVIVLLTQLTSGLVYVILGGKAIYGVINIGEVFMYAGAILELTASIRSEIVEYNSFYYRTEYLNTYYEFINKPNSNYTGTLPIEKRSDGEYEFAFENVSFWYPGTSSKILDNINLTFKVGQKYAIVGKNGAGKTTLIKLLCRLYDPTEGRILLNGIDIKYYDYEEYTKVFSVVFQDFKLLALPLSDNLTIGETSEEEGQWKVLEKAGIRNRIESMPHKLNTQLYKNNGEGVEVSGGEAQKIAIARALYKDGPFVILDEPTAALDPIAEAEIYENFSTIVEGKTAIYISHRMSSCKFCDNIIVIDGGNISERGTHEKLLKENGIYASLYNAQAQYYA